ncbi:MAG: hypothetical protein G8D91_22985 [gamma proteobacterium symbiont of Clathrolucina costata]
MLEYWSSKGKLAPIPPEYARARHIWLCEIMAEDDAGVVDEYELRPDKKMLLIDLLPILKDHLNTLVADEAVDCGFRVYRCK